MGEQSLKDELGSQIHSESYESLSLVFLGVNFAIFLVFSIMQSMEWDDNTNCLLQLWSALSGSWHTNSRHK